MTKLVKLLSDIIIYLWSLAFSAAFILSVVKLATEIKISWFGILMLSLSGGFAWLGLLIIAFIFDLFIISSKYLIDWYRDRNKIKKLMDSIE